MGTVELDLTNKTCTIHSNILLYGGAISELHRANIQEEISSMWNQPKAIVMLYDEPYLVQFNINCWLHYTLTPEQIVHNTNPKNNYIRIESTSSINISFVDGLGSNTGYFFEENLYKGSTTAAHEYGHTLGLDHPSESDIRGKGVPGIMYPRGTWVDPTYQYDPAALPGAPGGTMHPMSRRVLQQDIDLLGLHKLAYTNGSAVIGSYTNVWHEQH